MTVLTGIIRNLQGQIVANNEVKFTRLNAPVLYDAALLRPDEVTARTDGAGAFSVVLIPGQYTVSLLAKSTRPFVIGVPDSPTADIADLLNAPVALVDPLVHQAREYRDEAEAAAALAVAAANDVPPDYATRADFVAANTATPGLALSDGKIVTAAGYEYRRLSSSSAIADLAGWVPNGEVTPQHFGAVGNGVANDAAAIQDAIDAANNSGGRLLTVNGPGPYNISTAVDLGVAAIEMDGSVSFNGSNFILPSGYNFTNSERYGKKFTNSSVDGYDIYGNMFPSVSYYDVLQAVAYLPPGSSLGSHLSAISGYIRVDAAASGGGNNAVGLFAGGVVTVDSGAGWGINTLLQDSNTRTAHTGTGRVLLGAELDFNVMSPNTQIIGVSVGGNSLAQPTNANAYIVNTLSQTFGYKWVAGFASFDGCADNALSVGMTAATGNNLASQNVLFSWSNGSGVKSNIVLQASAGFLQVLDGNLSVGTGGSLFLQTGQGVRVNGLSVVTDRRTGWTAPTGTATRTTFDTATVTTAELAERVKGLIDDLTFHGLIGA